MLKRLVKTIFSNGYSGVASAWKTVALLDRVKLPAMTYFLSGNFGLKLSRKRW